MSSTYGTPIWATLGPIFKRMSDRRTNQLDFAPTSLTATTGINVIRNSVDPEAMSTIASLADLNILGDYARPALRALVEAAHRVVIDQVNQLAAVAPRSDSIEEAFREMAAQMVNDSDSLDGNDTGVTSAARSGNSGDGLVLATPFAPVGISRGVSLSAATEGQFIRNELWKVTCTADANSGFAAGNELFRIQPERGYDNLDRRWRGGSGPLEVYCNCTSSYVESANEPGQNLLYNSAFERAATANIADGWVARTGSVGTEIATTATAWNGSQAMRLIGGGTSNPAIGQLLGSSSGSPVTLNPDTTYAITFWTRSNSGTVSKTLTAQFADSSGTAIGLSGAASVTISSHTTSYSRTSGYIHTPANLSPGTYYFDLRNTGTTLAGGEEIYIDGVIVAPVVRIAKGSGGICIVTGATQFRKDDHFNVTWTNNDAGDLLYWADCVFRCYENGFVLPVDTGGSETILDSLFA